MFPKVRRGIEKGKEVWEDRLGRKAKVGFIGCGRHATTNLYPALRHAPLELVATCARHLEKARHQAQLFGAPRAYDDYLVMLDEEELDAILVVVDAEQHYKMAREALERGLAVFVEKPPAPDAARAKELIEVSRRAGKGLMVGFQKRFAPAYGEAKRLIARPHHIALKFCVGPTGSVREYLMEIAIHHLDLARFFVGEVERLYAERAVEGAGLSLAVSLKFVGGAVGTMHLSNRGAWAKPNERVELMGQGVSVVVDNVVNLTCHQNTASPPGLVPPDGEKSLTWQPNFTVPTAENQSLFLNGYVYEIRHFAQTVLRSQPPSPDIYDGHQALKLVEALEKNEGKVIQF